MTFTSMLKFLLLKPKFFYFLCLFAGVFGLIICWYDFDLTIIGIIRLALFFLCLFILYTMLTAFINTFFLIKKIKNSKFKAVLYLQCIPFMPSLIFIVYYLLSVRHFGIGIIVYYAAVKGAIVMLFNFMIGMILIWVSNTYKLFDEENKYV